MILMVEGEHDIEMWKAFIAKAGIPTHSVKLNSVRNGGWAEAAKATSLIELLDEIGISKMPRLLVMEADENIEQKRQKMAELGIDKDDYEILPSDMEAYLIESAAIASVLDMERARVASAIRKAGGKPSKEKLERVFELLGKHGISASTKNKLAGALKRLPADIEKVLQKIRVKLEAAP